MSIVETLSRSAGRIAEDVQHSLKRARLEGERRLLLRDHRGALEALGARVIALGTSAPIEREDVAAEVAAVASRAAELAAKEAEIAALRDAVSEPEATSDPATADRQIASGAPRAGAGWDAAARFFPKR